MDADLIKLVNKLQDTFANLGTHSSCWRSMFTIDLYRLVGGELDMPQLAVVRLSLFEMAQISKRRLRFRSAVSPQGSLVSSRRTYSSFGIVVVN